MVMFAKHTIIKSFKKVFEKKKVFEVKSVTYRLIQ